MKGSGEGKKEQLQPYKEGSDGAERNSLRWLWPDGLKLGAKAWDSKSWEMGQGSECWHQLEQDMAGLVFLQCARGFTFSEVFHWHQHSGKNPSIHMLPAPARAEVLVPRVQPLSHTALRFLPRESTW